jgi:dTDP-4-dehydrorhamnose 3,5-epimerase
MIFAPLPISGAFQIEMEPRTDPRGSFARMFCAEEFATHGLNANWVQMNASITQEKGTLRGLHFQNQPKPEAKLIRCIKGAIHDVVVDFRAGSPTFGEHCTLELSDVNRTMIYIPKGCAHGFQTLRSDTELLYAHSEYYSQECESGVHFADPDLAIHWPLEPIGLSDRDASFSSFAQLEPIQL